MDDLTLGRLRVSAVVERAGPTRPTWLLPDALPEAVDRHRAWLAPHFLDDKGRFLQSVHSFVVRAPGLTALVDTCMGTDKHRGGRLLHAAPGRPRRPQGSRRSARVRRPGDLHAPPRRPRRLEHAAR